MNITTLVDREQLGAWLNKAGLTKSMVEVGCAFGGYARIVLKDWKGAEYVMVDPWIAQPQEVYKEKTAGTPYDGWFKDCEKLAGEDKRVRLERRYSLDAAPLFADGHFDCIFLDGNHCREAVAADLVAWWPKVKSGGVFGGHDFYDVVDKVGTGYYNEVKSAVEAWAPGLGLTIHSTPCTSWWITKP